MNFNVGDKAVYPAHGVGIIRDVVTEELSGEKATFYVLKILDNGMTIRVPVHNAQQIGMRTIINREQIDKVYEILKNRDVPTDNQTWNRRYRDYMSKIKTGDPIEVIRRGISWCRRSRWPGTTTTSRSPSRSTRSSRRSERGGRAAKNRLDADCCGRLHFGACTGAERACRNGRPFASTIR